MNIVVHLKVLMGVLLWAALVFLQVLVMTIARFFEKTSGQRTFHRAYWFPICLTTAGIGRYIIRIAAMKRAPDFTGDPIANLLLLGAGLALIGLSNHLYEKMMLERA